MLTREIMGALALAILWVNTLLVALAAWKQASEKLRLHRDLRPLAPGAKGTGLFAARVDAADEGRTIARYRLEQIGRAGAEAGGRRTIHFGDRVFRGESLGGEVIAGNMRVRIPKGEASVWVAREDVIAAAACPDQARFDEVFEQARKARGHVREVTVAIEAGSPVWIGGEVHDEGGELSVRAAPGTGLLVSAVEPRAWLRRAAALAIVFSIVEIAIAAGVTFLVLRAPIFDGWTSRIGGALGLGFFLAVQPIGTAVRDALRDPSLAFVRGRWIEPASSSRGAAVEPEARRT